MDDWASEHWDVMDSEEEDLKLFLDTHPYIPREVIMPPDLFDRSDYELERNASQYQNAQHLKSLGMSSDHEDLAYFDLIPPKQKKPKKSIDSVAQKEKEDRINAIYANRNASRTLRKAAMTPNNFYKEDKISPERTTKGNGKQPAIAKKAEEELPSVRSSSSAASSSAAPSFNSPSSSPIDYDTLEWTRHIAPKGTLPVQWKEMPGYLQAWFEPHIERIKQD